MVTITAVMFHQCMLTRACDLLSHMQCFGTGPSCFFTILLLA